MGPTRSGASGPTRQHVRGTPRRDEVQLRPRRGEEPDPSTAASPARRWPDRSRSAVAAVVASPGGPRKVRRRRESASLCGGDAAITVTMVDEHGDDEGARQQRDATGRGGAEHGQQRFGNEDADHEAEDRTPPVPVIAASMSDGGVTWARRDQARATVRALRWCAARTRMLKVLMMRKVPTKREMKNAKTSSGVPMNVLIVYSVLCSARRAACWPVSASA